MKRKLDTEQLQSEKRIKIQYGPFTSKNSFAISYNPFGLSKESTDAIDADLLNGDVLIKQSVNNLFQSENWHALIYLLNHPDFAREAFINKLDSYLDMDLLLFIHQSFPAKKDPLIQGWLKKEQSEQIICSFALKVLAEPEYYQSSHTGLFVALITVLKKSTPDYPTLDSIIKNIYRFRRFDWIAVLSNTLQVPELDEFLAQCICTCLVEPINGLQPTLAEIHFNAFHFEMKKNIIENLLTQSYSVESLLQIAIEDESPDTFTLLLADSGVRTAFLRKKQSYLSLCFNQKKCLHLATLLEPLLLDQFSKDPGFKEHLPEIEKRVYLFHAQDHKEATFSKPLPDFANFSKAIQMEIARDLLACERFRFFATKENLILVAIQQNHRELYQLLVADKRVQEAVVYDIEAIKPLFESRNTELLIDYYFSDWFIDILIKKLEPVAFWERFYACLENHASNEFCKQVLNIEIYRINCLKLCTEQQCFSIWKTFDEAGLSSNLVHIVTEKERNLYSVQLARIACQFNQPALFQSVYNHNEDINDAEKLEALLYMAKDNISIITWLLKNPLFQEYFEDYEFQEEGQSLLNAEDDLFEDLLPTPEDNLEYKTCFYENVLKDNDSITDNLMLKYAFRYGTAADVQIILTEKKINDQAILESLVIEALQYQNKAALVYTLKNYYWTQSHLIKFFTESVHALSLWQAIDETKQPGSKLKKYVLIQLIQEGDKQKLPQLLEILLHELQYTPIDFTEDFQKAYFYFLKVILAYGNKALLHYFLLLTQRPVNFSQTFFPSEDFTEAYVPYLVAASRDYSILELLVDQEPSFKVLPGIFTGLSRLSTPEYCSSFINLWNKLFEYDNVKQYFLANVSQLMTLFIANEGDLSRIFYQLRVLAQRTVQIKLNEQTVRILICTKDQMKVMMENKDLIDWSLLFSNAFPAFFHRICRSLIQSTTQKVQNNVENFIRNMEEIYQNNPLSFCYPQPDYQAIQNFEWMRKTSCFLNELAPPLDALRIEKPLFNPAFLRKENPKKNTRLLNAFFSYFQMIPKENYEKVLNFINTTRLDFSFTEKELAHLFVFAFMAARYDLCEKWAPAIGQTSVAIDYLLNFLFKQLFENNMFYIQKGNPLFKLFRLIFENCKEKEGRHLMNNLKILSGYYQKKFDFFQKVNHLAVELYHSLAINLIQGSLPWMQDVSILQLEQFFAENSMTFHSRHFHQTTDNNKLIKNAPYYHQMGTVYLLFTCLNSVKRDNYLPFDVIKEILGKLLSVLALEVEYISFDPYPGPR